MLSTISATASFGFGSAQEDTMKKIPLLAAAGVGYVLGAKAGRERYNQLRNATQRVTHDPRVQETAHRAADVAREKAPEVKDAVQTKLTSVASTAVHKVRPGSGGVDGSSQPHSDQGSFEDEGYPDKLR